MQPVPSLSRWRYSWSSRSSVASSKSSAYTWRRQRHPGAIPFLSFVAFFSRP